MFKVDAANLKLATKPAQGQIVFHGGSMLLCMRRPGDPDEARLKFLELNAPDPAQRFAVRVEAEDSSIRDVPALGVTSWRVEVPADYEWAFLALETVGRLLLMNDGYHIICTLMQPTGERMLVLANPLTGNVLSVDRPPRVPMFASWRLSGETAKDHWTVLAENPPQP